MNIRVVGMTSPDATSIGKKWNVRGGATHRCLFSPVKLRLCPAGDDHVENVGIPRFCHGTADRIR
jgi:hypothetical protein